MIFSRKEQIGKYIVSFPIKEGNYAETYRVKDEKGKNYFLKLFDYSKLHRKQFFEDNSILEVEISHKLNHQNLTLFKDSGEIIVGDKNV